MLGLLVMVGFGFAFVVLFGDEFVSDDGENFNSPLRSFESLFYAALGDFDPDVRSSSLSVVISESACIGLQICTRWVYFEVEDVSV